MKGLDAIITGLLLPQIPDFFLSFSYLWKLSVLPNYNKINASSNELPMPPLKSNQAKVTQFFL